MKQLIVPVAIIAGLILFFYIIDRKDFNHADHNQTVQAISSAKSNRKTTVKTSATKSLFESGNSGLEPMQYHFLAEQINSLIDSIRQEVSSQNGERRVYYRENFDSHHICLMDFANNKNNAELYQTVNWKCVSDLTNVSTHTHAKKDVFFHIKSNRPLEYNFILPLRENKMYSYTLGCRAYGKGTITLAAKGSDDYKKDFEFDSDEFKYVSLDLGNGSNFENEIIPSITFSGDMHIESIVLYQNRLDNKYTVALGVVEEISEVPDITQSDYPDCYYSAVFVVKDILDGEPIPERIQLLIPAFMNRIVDPLSEIMKKGNWRIVARPFSMATEYEQAIEQVDELDSYMYDSYILVDAESFFIPELSTSGVPVLNGKKYVSPYDTPINLPLKSDYVRDSQSIIDHELKKVNSIISKSDNAEAINSAFQQSWNGIQRKYDFLTDSNLIWANEKNSFFSLPPKWTFVHPTKVLDENIEALVELDRFLKYHGIQFIIQIVPNYYDIAALVLNPAFQEYGDIQSALPAKQLLERGIETHYISDEIVKNAFHYERLFFYPDDYHPDEGAVDIMTSLMAERLKLFDSFPPTLSSDLFSEEMLDSYNGVYIKWPSGVDIGSHEENTNVKTPYIKYKGESILPDNTSKVMVIGNSFVYSPFPDAYISYLSKKMLYVPFRKSMSGNGLITGLLNLLFLDSDTLLKNRLVVILPISVNYLTSKIHFLNIKQLDAEFRKKDSSEFLFSTSANHFASEFFSPNVDLDFKPQVQQFIENHPGSILLSSSSNSIHIPLSTSSPKTIEVSVCPIDYGKGATFFANGDKYQIPGSKLPMWITVQIPVSENQTDMNLSLDQDNSYLLIGSVSYYK